MVNPRYTEFLLALRYVCLFISVLFAIYYWRSLRQMRGEKLVFEQKFIRVLGILLILFNDPICASTILKPTLARYFFPLKIYQFISAVFSSMFVITFVCALLLFWIAAFQVTFFYRSPFELLSRESTEKTLKFAQKLSHGQNWFIFS